MKQKKISTESPHFDGYSDTSNRSISNDIADLYEKECSKNQMRKICLCADCREEILFNNQSQSWPIRCFACDWNGQFKDYEKHLTLDHPSDTYICSDQLSFNHCVCEEWIIQKKSYVMHMSLHLSSTHCTDASKIKNTPYKRMDLEKKVTVLEKNIIITNNDIQHLNGEFIRLKDALQQLTQDVSEQNLLAIRQKMEDLHHSSFDGSLVWRIDEVTKKSHEARSGKKTSIYSPVFYSSPTGYKMRARLDLYGDGDARGTHMSIFLVILKGEYDAILPWPFTFPVIFGLFDQINQKHVIVDSFCPNTTSTSSQRPRSRENIASGISKFCLLEVIQRQGNCYVQNDTMYIKIMLDFLGTPRPLLPYTIGVNPGLPTHEQEAIHRRAIEQYRELRAKLVEEINRNEQELAQRAIIPHRPQVLARIRQQPPSSTTGSASIPCEDIPVDD